eukprot:TRINITY_DN3126_c1_g1_i2.p2 TRINITY_DN3126_c1_g1~~TRINITY_DN3126_c1_g1_i2.p2  ORF type:complete len:147 (+),score=8.12 TRINITY_DN3126_c1_g1_i2:1296-1736(+)
MFLPKFHIFISKLLLFCSFVGESLQEMNCVGTYNYWSTTVFKQVTIQYQKINEFVFTVKSISISLGMKSQFKERAKLVSVGHMCGCTYVWWLLTTSSESDKQVVISLFVFCCLWCYFFVLRLDAFTKYAVGVSELGYCTTIKFDVL